MKKTQVEMESRIIEGAHGVAAEEDHIKTVKIVGIGAGSLFIFVLGCIWAVFIMNRTIAEVAPDGAAPTPAAIGQYEIGIVNQRLFEQDYHAEQKIDSQQAALAAGWGDKPGVVAHPKLEQAMESVIASERQAREQQQPPQQPAQPQPQK
ncbi:hypothetical protein P2318_28180 [Myxococcaceae bacterium GXIMD 01537]